jgi:antitoxin component of RelBE/YafQ-DinJ toxin-antitoxin module
MEEKRIPNEETVKAMKDSDEGKNLTRCSTVEEMIEELKS